MSSEDWNWYTRYLTELYAESGSTDTKFLDKKKVKEYAFCKICKELIDFDTGAHLFINTTERMHINCFAEKVQDLIDSGEIDKITKKEELENAIYKFC